MKTQHSYSQAVSRGDLSEHLVHLTKDTPEKSAFDILFNILEQGTIQASTTQHITKYSPNGCTCFYDVPIQFYQQLIETNPNNRKPYGIIVNKATFWSIGGRPAIYTSNTDPDIWPIDERFRIINTNLQTVDWMHEREWRLGNSVKFQVTNPNHWWPMVKTVLEAQITFQKFNSITDVFVLDLMKVLNKSEISH